MTPEEQLCADLAPLQDRASEPDEFDPRSCLTVLALLVCFWLLVGGSVWAWAETAWSVTR